MFEAPSGKTYGSGLSPRLATELSTSFRVAMALSRGFSTGFPPRPGHDALGRRTTIVKRPAVERVILMPQMMASKQTHWSVDMRRPVQAIFMAIVVLGGVACRSSAPSASLQPRAASYDEYAIAACASFGALF